MPKTASKLLKEYALRLSRSDEQQALDERKIDTLIQNVNYAEDFDLS